MQGERFSFSKQIENFGITKRELQNQLSDTDLKHYLEKALAVLILGSNDYIYPEKLRSCFFLLLGLESLSIRYFQIYGLQGRYHIHHTSFKSTDNMISYFKAKLMTMLT